MKLRLLGWSYEGIRGVHNLDVNVSDSKGKPYPISLIMMPNGTGKTTTMKLLRAVFDGSADQWSVKDVKDFRPPDAAVKKGKFQAKVLLDDSLIVIQLVLDYARGSASYKTTRVQHGGLEEGLKLPSVVRAAFSENFVRRFIFDGELARDIFKSGNDEAERAINYLYRLDQLDELYGAIGQVVADEQQSKSSTTAKTPQGLAKLRTEADIARAKLAELQVDQAKLQLEHDRGRARLIEIAARINEKMRTDKGLSDRVRDLEKERSLNREAVKNQALNVLSQARDPYLLSSVLSTRLDFLATSMQRLKLPKSTSSEFFEELAENKQCVCGRPLGPVECAHIKATAKNYLADDQIGAMNTIKGSLRTRDYSAELGSSVGELSNSLDERKRLNREWGKLTTLLANEGDTELEELKAEESKLTAHLGQLFARLDDLTTIDKVRQDALGWGQNVPKCRAELATREQRVGEATETLGLMQKADVTKSHLLSIKASAMSALKRRIMKATNDKVAFILRSERIEVQSIEKNLVLKQKTGVSEGQSLAIAYSYLGSLFGESSYSLPFAVDTPAGPLDLDVRRNVSTVLPGLFEQLIVFITSGERKGFADHFYELKSKVQFLTIFTEPGQNAQCSNDIRVFQTFQDEAK